MNYFRFKVGKKYNIIYADPPWSYKDKALAGNRGACCKYLEGFDVWGNEIDNDITLSCY